MAITFQNLLDAIEGIAMILDRDLNISRVGGPNWERFFEANRPSDLTDSDFSKASVLDRPVLQFFAGTSVRSTYA
ncbi:hypothetical protein [Parvibaculum sp.]|uniref:hypothetical protein n=1 Tax=Parvibaculum sp. TaxID=2024848 RepID=UPI003BA8F2B0